MIGRHDADTFQPLWQQVRAWQSYFYVTDGWKVYPNFIDSGDHIVSKTYMTRVEGENTRLRHYERSVASQDIMLLKVSRNAELLDSIASALLKISLTTKLRLIHT